MNRNVFMELVLHITFVCHEPKEYTIVDILQNQSSTPETQSGNTTAQENVVKHLMSLVTVQKPGNLFSYTMLYDLQSKTRISYEFQR